MAMLANPAAPPLERIRQNLVGLRMPRALEILDAVVSRLERGEITALEAIDVLLAEELTLRESRRIKAALVMARISQIKMLSGFDFAFQPSLERSRILALAELRLSWPRFLWTPICPKRDRNDGVQHDEDRRERSR